MPLAPPFDSNYLITRQIHCADRNYSPPASLIATTPVAITSASHPKPAGMISSGLSRRDTKSSHAGQNQDIVPPLPTPVVSGGGSMGPQSAGAIYQHIHDMASKRISTLDYLRKALVESLHFHRRNSLDKWH